MRLAVPTLASPAIAALLLATAAMPAAPARAATLPGPTLATVTAPARPERSVDVAPGSRGLLASLRPADAATAARVTGWSAARMTGWSPNLGQIADATGRPNADVLFST